MTDEERQKLCEELRTATPGNVTVKAGYRAADELERLAYCLSLANDGWAKANSEILRLQSYKDETANEIERLQNELRLWKEQG